MREVTFPGDGATLPPANTLGPATIPAANAELLVLARLVWRWRQAQRAYDATASYHTLELCRLIRNQLDAALDAALDADLLHQAIPVDLLGRRDAVTDSGKGGGL